ncbi:MAG: hypothetical protein LBD02_07015 [Christensenellaceae bacterium]|jgi:hypothetical protein|nr:hypothetical protein [Christensenellaceae bacterium]
METHTKPVSIQGKVFKRRGSWFGLYHYGPPGEEPSFYLGTVHGTAALAPGKNKLIGICVTCRGERVDYSLEAYPAELILRTAHGCVRFSFASSSMILAEGDEGMGLLFEKTMARHESVHERKGGAWEAFFRMTCAVVFKGLNGSGFDFNDGTAPWDLDELSSCAVCGQTRPGPGGGFTLAMEESVFDGVVRDEYPGYAEAKASMQADWDEFIEKMPAFAAPYESAREGAEYTLWSFLTEPCGMAKHTMILMFAANMASQWQMCQNAVALQAHTALAVDLLLGPIERISPLGQLPDMYDDSFMESLMVKPPMHGWAVLEILKRQDLFKAVPREKIETLYAGMGRWADWFLTHRDDDGDGLPNLVHSDESGFDDCSLWENELQIASPEVSSYLALLFEACGELAKRLGKPEEESTAWFQKSKTLLSRMIGLLWDGRRFAGLSVKSRKKLYSGSIVHYMPVILGNRLPKPILDQLVADLADPATFFSPWGIASENMTSKLFVPFGWGRGCVLPPSMLYIVTGLWDTEHRAFAKKAGENYCKALIEGDFPFFIDSKTGEGRYYGCSWTACAYTVLAGLISQEE